MFGIEFTLGEKAFIGLRKSFIAFFCDISGNVIRQFMRPVFGNEVLVIIEIVIVIYPILYVIGSIAYFFYISGCQRKCKNNGMRKSPVLCFTQLRYIDKSNEFCPAVS